MRRPSAILAISLQLVLLISPNVSFAAHPCSEIAKKCRTEGYAVGGANSSGQGVVKDCLEKVLAGQTLPGININFETLGACKVRYQASQNARSDKPSRKITSNAEPVRARRKEPTGLVEYTGQSASSSSSASSSANGAK